MYMYMYLHLHLHIHIHIHIRIIHTHSSRTMSSLFWACPNGVGDSLWRIQKILHLVNHAFLGTLRHLHWIDVFLQTLGIPISNSGLKNTNILEMLKSQRKLPLQIAVFIFFPHSFSQPLGFSSILTLRRCKSCQTPKLRIFLNLRKNSFFYNPLSSSILNINFERYGTPTSPEATVGLIGMGQLDLTIQPSRAQERRVQGIGPGGNAQSWEADGNIVGIVGTLW